MPLRAALVGAGRVARVHLEALKGTDQVELLGLCDLNAELARERAEAYGIPRVYGSWDELLKDEAVQCVGVLLPHDIHERMATEALAAGKHVVCEKPLAPTLPECDRMLAASERAGRQLNGDRPDAGRIVTRSPRRSLSALATAPGAMPTSTVEVCASSAQVNAARLAPRRQARERITRSAR